MLGRKNGERVTTFSGVCELREENVGIMCGGEERRRDSKSFYFGSKLTPDIASSKKLQG